VNLDTAPSLDPPSSVGDSMSQYGLPISTHGGVPAGADADVGHLILSAPITHHMRVIALDMDGGDSNEIYDFYMFPPGTVFPTVSGTPPANAVVWMTGSKGAPNFPTSVINQMTGEGRTSGFLVLPAGWSLAVIPVSAASAAAMTVNVVAVPMAVA